ncbi:LCP family protein [Adlercreutzia sp. ZJ141]|uniref:LCP family protein n=1 Tax=Adlercreutzia sp. ZJ141 TaxID=2709406 RepID=UPI001F14EC00|nr:LCP family protein [Adlercreutzia sp. ZJ141]
MTDINGHRHTLRPEQAHPAGRGQGMNVPRGEGSDKGAPAAGKSAAGKPTAGRPVAGRSAAGAHAAPAHTQVPAASTHTRTQTHAPAPQSGFVPVTRGASYSGAPYGAGSGARGIGSGAYGAAGAYGAEAFGSDGLVKVKKKKNKAVKIALIVFAVLFTIIVGLGIAFAAWVGSLGKSMSIEDEQQATELKDALAPSVSVKESDEPFYMLLLGSDARGDEASRSDVTMLARIDSASAKVDLISIPRDTMVTIEGQGTQKINAAYTFGGPAGAVETVSEFAGVPISHYAEIHFDELKTLVDMLGGVWVNVPEGFSSGNGGVSLQAGEQLLNGDQALAFARERYNVSGGDFGRAQAQRIIVEAIIKQILAASPVEMPGLIGNLAGCVSTDLAMSDLVPLAQKFQGKNLTMYSAACPSYSYNVDGISYVCPMFDEWRAMMQRVDAGLDPNDKNAVIPQEQLDNAALGAAPNSPAPRDYADLAANAGLTTDDVAPEVNN